MVAKKVGHLRIDVSVILEGQDILSQAIDLWFAEDDERLELLELMDSTNYTQHWSSKYATSRPRKVGIHLKQKLLFPKKCPRQKLMRRPGLVPELHNVDTILQRTSAYKQDPAILCSWRYVPKTGCMLRTFVLHSPLRDWAQHWSPGGIDSDHDYIKGKALKPTWLSYICIGSYDSNKFLTSIR